MMDQTETSTSALLEPVKPAGARRALELFIISLLLLFLELACIRWFGSMVVFLTFFTNLVLLACFLGTTVGCLAARQTRNYIQLVFPIAFLAAAISAAPLFLHDLPQRFAHNLLHMDVFVDVGHQQSPQEVFFGTEPAQGDLSKFVIPLEVIAGLFFVLTALVFVGIGQELGRRFDEIPNRVIAYSVNVLGSLCGIVLFGITSWLRGPPLIWFALAGAFTLLFLRRTTWFQLVCLIGLLVVTGRASYTGDRWAQVIWSPYYKVEYHPLERLLVTNNIGHQAMVPYTEAGGGRDLPYLLARDAGGKPFEDVLIIGAGSGNDVFAARAQGARHIDAVEIEPLFSEIGKQHHPDHPFQEEVDASGHPVHRVNLYLNDGRNFLSHPRPDRDGTVPSYDLAIYALVDSLVLHSGFSSLRLESYLFTEQAFRDVRARLRPGGVFAMYNYYRQGWVIGRLAKMAETVFGTKPVVVSLPYQAQITPDENQAGFITLLMVANGEGGPVPAIRQRLEKTFFWLNSNPVKNAAINGYGPQPPAAHTFPSNGQHHGVLKPDLQADASWQKVGLAEVDTTGIDRLPTDDWPFLYLRAPVIPNLNLRGMGVIAGLSLAILLAFAPVRRLRPNGQMFFLGAGFMLLETKGVVHMALLFGSTWKVNSIVFFTVLVMILLSNLFVLAFQPRRLWPYYVLVGLTLGANALVPVDYYLGLADPWKTIVSCTVVFVPVFFAGVIFAAAFRHSRQPDVDFGSNIGGVILGGLSEYLSLMLGFNHLLLVAVGFYALAWLLAPRLRAAPA
jgi:SAM-dependent methyltransferase